VILVTKFLGFGHVASLSLKRQDSTRLRLLA
jgi:hypothetical protein